MDLKGRRGYLVIIGTLVAALAAAFALASPGDPDPGFGTTGETLFGTGTSVAAVARLDSGTLVAAGHVTSSGVTKVLVTRTTASGTAIGSPLAQAIGDGNDAEAQNVVMDDQNRPVVSGFAKDGGKFLVMVARFKADGTGLDTTFNGTGFNLIDISSGDDSGTQALGLAIDSQKRIVVAGGVRSGTIHREFVARLTPAGVLDTAAFNTGGIQAGIQQANFRSSKDEQFEALTLDGADRPVAAGYITPDPGAGPADETHKRLFTQRLNTNGSADSTFGDGNGVGNTVTALGHADAGDHVDASAQGIAIAGGKVVLAGYAVDGNATDGFHQRPFVARYTIPGDALDSGFGDNGTKIVPFGPGDSDAQALAVQANGTFVTTGTTATGGSDTKALAVRFLSDGKLDAGFGAAGGVTLGSTTDATGAAVLATPDDKLIVGGTEGGKGFLDRISGTASPAVVQTVVGSSPTPTPSPGIQLQPQVTSFASFKAPTTVELGETATFTATSQGFGGYLWDFDGDGSFETNAKSNPTVDHAFDFPGKINVSLRVVDSIGRVTTSTRVVTVIRPPVAQVRWKPAYPKPGEKVTFTIDNASDPGDTPQYYLWKVKGIGPANNVVKVPAATVSRPGVLGVAISGSRRSTRAGTPAYGPLPVDKPLAPDPTVKVKSKTKTITKDPTFSGSFKTAGAYPITAGFATQDGRIIYAHGTIGVHDKFSKPKEGDPGHPISAKECAQVLSGCPEISVGPDLVTGFKIPFVSKGYQGKKQCIGPGAPKNNFNILQDPGYPSDFVNQVQTPDGGAFTAPVAGRSTRSSRSAETGDRDAPTADTSQCLVSPDFATTILQWDTDDGTKVPKGQVDGGAIGPNTFSHVFKTAGAHTVGVTARVAVNFLGHKTTMYVRQSVKIDIVNPVCQDSFNLSTIPLRTGHARAGGAAGCFIPINGKDKPQIVRPFTGDEPVLGSVRLTGTHPIPAVTDDTPVQIELSKNTILSGAWEADFKPPKADSFTSHAPGDGPSGVGRQGDTFGLRGSISGKVKKPSFKAEAGGPATTIAGSGNQVGNLPIGIAHAFLSKDKPAHAVAQLELPKPLTGTTKLLGDSVTKFGDGGQSPLNKPKSLRSTSRAGAITGNDADYTMALPDGAIGPFDASDISMSHRVESEGGGWFGGAKFSVLGLFDLDAPFIPGGFGNTSDQCGEGGPSGFSLKDNGDFDSGGASFEAGVGGDIPLGPVGLSCVQIAGSATPFSLSGKAAVDFPLDSHVFDGNVCFGVASGLHAGEQIGLCGDGYAALAGETWVHANGDISLFNVVPLATAYFDSHTSADQVAIDAGGGINWDFAIIGIHLNVAGQGTSNPAQFQLEGSGSVDIPDTCPFCLPLSLDVLVSNKGVAACTFIVGFDYLYSGGFDIFGGCDLSDNPVRVFRGSGLPDSRSLLLDPTGRAAPFGARMDAPPVTLDKDYLSYSFEATGVDAGPKLIVTDNHGHTYADKYDGTKNTVRQKSAGLTVLHLDKADQQHHIGRTILTLRGDLKKGTTYTVKAAPGSVPIKDLNDRAGVAAPGVIGHLSGKGQHRKITYKFAQAPGRSVQFYEKGAATARPIGTPQTAAMGSVDFPPGFGSKGKRSVYGIVRENGVDRKRYPIGTYLAKGPPKISQPGKIAIKATSDGAKLSWKKVKGAMGYDITVEVANGQVIQTHVKTNSLKLPSVTSGESVAASVAAVSKYKVISSARLATKLPKPPSAITLTL